MIRTDQNELLRQIVDSFIEKQRISCAESIYQTDRVIENAYTLIEDLANVVGYYVEDADDES